MINRLTSLIKTMPGADLPHRHGPMTAGEVTRQLLAMHPLAKGATQEEVAKLVMQVATSDMDTHQLYMLGGIAAGKLGGPGTWISVGGSADGMVMVSATIPVLYTSKTHVTDPTVADRIQAELERRMIEQGENPAIVRVLRAERLDFAGDDNIVFATPRGEHSFHGFFSHITHFSNGERNRLKEAVRDIIAHHVHSDEIERRINLMRRHLEQQFAPLGSNIGETTLLTLDLTETGGLDKVSAVTLVSIVGDDLEWTNVMITTEGPPTGTTSDRSRILARDTRRRLRILAGRTAAEARTICPVLDDHLTSGINADLVLQEIEWGRRGGRDEDDEEPDGLPAKGFMMRDGRLSATVQLGEGVTWRNRTLQAAGQTLPQTLLAVLPGRPMHSVCGHPSLADMTVATARNDAKGRLTVTAEPVVGRPLLATLKRLKKVAAR